MPSDQQRWILIHASLPANPVSLPAGSADLIVTASGVGNELATTGIDLWPPLLAALLAVFTGLILASSARLVGVRQRRRDEVTP